MNKLKKTFFSISQSQDLGFTIFSLWFFNELSFNILPIIVILIINIAFGESFEKIFLLPDWSFASIVLFGGTIGMFIELKTKYQKDDSHKVYTGTRLFTILLIASVISLTLALLREKGIAINEKFISVSQVVLFLMSAVSLLVPISFIQDILNIHNMPPETVQAKKLMRYLLFSFEEANEHIKHSIISLNDNRQTINELCQTSIIGSDFIDDKERLESLITQIEVNIGQLKNEWNEGTQVSKASQRRKRLTQ